MLLSVNTNDDYACVSQANPEKTWEDAPNTLMFYYGYEFTERPDDEDDPGDWCFVVLKDEETLFKLTSSQLDKYITKEDAEPSEYLAAGMYLYYASLS